MVSLVEAKWNTVLNSYHPPVPKVNDLLVQTYRRVVNVESGLSEDWDFPYYFHQLDCVTLPGVIKYEGPEDVGYGPDPGVQLPKLPINWELDDPTHDKLKRSRKDHSRDIHLWECSKWVVKKSIVPELNGLSGSQGWVIARVKYEDLEQIVRPDLTLNLEHRSLKDPAKRAKYREEHEAILNSMNGLIGKCLNATGPCRISLKDGEILTQKEFDGDE